MKAGSRLRALRSRLGISTREVAEQSHQIADAEGNPEFYISNAWLTKLENTDSVPSIHKLITLSAVYQIGLNDLLELFGINLDLNGKRQLEITHRQTQLLRLDVGDQQKPITFPVEFAEGLSLDSTNLLSRMVAHWGEVPVAAIQRLNLQHHHYGFIGFQDFTLYPLLRPGSFVEIDRSVRKVHTAPWRTEFDRPIYFLELRNRYACGWCELQGSDLTLLPHPLSPCTIQRFHFPGQAEIVGQVTGIAMRLVETQEENPKLLRHT
jgi:transcriptional regulator with XRE-family HTH domain